MRENPKHGSKVQWILKVTILSNNFGNYKTNFKIGTTHLFSWSSKWTIWYENQIFFLKKYNERSLIQLNVASLIKRQHPLVKIKYRKKYLTSLKMTFYMGMFPLSISQWNFWYRRNYLDCVNNSILSILFFFSPLRSS